MTDIIKKLLFPQKCKCCFQLCEKDNLCQRCRAKLSILRIQNPDRTSEKKIDFVDSLYSSYYYRDEARDVVLNAKYKDMSSFINSLQKDISGDIETIYSANQIDLVLSVPYHKSKLYGTEHDLPFEMAKVISKMTGVPHIQCVEKTVKTKSQHKLDKSARKANLINAFTVTENVEGKNILIVDDVVTSGATLSVIAAELKIAQCNKIIAYTYTFNEEREKTNGIRK